MKRKFVVIGSCLCSKGFEKVISIGKASVINGAAKYSTVILNILFTAVLSRILSPEDYGIVAITAVFTVFFGLFADVGLGAGVIQNQKLTKKKLQNLFLNMT